MAQRSAFSAYETENLRRALLRLDDASADDLRWILRDCDHPTAVVCDKRQARTFDPKGFWRVDKELAARTRTSTRSPSGCATRACAR